MTMSDDLMFEQLNSLRNIPREPNSTAAATVNAMMQMGYFEKEFTVYGIAFYKDGKRQYMVSSQEEKIINFLENEMNFIYFPTPITSMTESVLVPSGLEDDIIRTVKNRLANKLAVTYPEEYFFDLGRLCDVPANDVAAPILKNWQEQLEGTFNVEHLQLFSCVLGHAFCKKNITELTYYKMKQWLQRIQKDMSYGTTNKMPYKQIFYGYGYEKDNGESGYYVNARKDSICQYKMSHGNIGNNTTPIVSKTYYFSNNIPIQQRRKCFENDLPHIFSKEFWDVWIEIKKMNTPILEKQSFYSQVKNIKNKYGEYGEKAIGEICKALDIQNN